MDKLRKFEIKRLRFALDHKDKRVPLTRMFAGNWKFYLIFLFVFGGCAGWMWRDGDYEESAFLLGAIFGVLWRDLTYARLFQMVKPVSDYVTAWAKVEELLEGNEAS